MYKLKRNISDKGYILLIGISVTILLGCVSKNSEFPNYSETYLLQNMTSFSITEPAPNSKERLWYFNSYASVIPNLQIHSGVYLSSGEILAAHMLWGEQYDQGTVIMIHGYNGTILNTHFQYFAQQFIQKGYRVILLNIPGHEFSGGKRGNIKDFSDYRKMLVDFLKLTEGQLGENLVLIGHSVGAATIYDAFIQSPEVLQEVDTAVLIAPFKDLKFSGIYQLSAYFVPGINVEQEELLQLNRVSTEWILKVREWSKEIENYPTLVGKEMLIIFGEEDNVIKNEISQEFFNEKIKNKKIRTYKGQGHLLVKDGYKKFRTETMDWIFSQLSPVSNGAQ